MEPEQLERILKDVMESMKLDESERFQAERCVKRIGNMILIRCNREDIPKILEPVIAQMAEDILREELDTGGNGKVSSITRGDTSISYRDDTALTQASARILKDYEAQLRRFKKMNLPK